MSWWQETTFYQIYPIGYCGAPRSNDFSECAHRLGRIEQDIPRLKELGVGAVLFNPLLKSSSHGYDTVDLFSVDNRLGDNADFKRLADKLHSSGIKVVCDAVFNHVGRDFYAFMDVKAHREQSRYAGRFNINFGGNSPYNDGLWYEGWEGHFDLVKLNLNNREVVDELKRAVKMWIEEFGIDGLRFDVGYMLPEWFLREMNDYCRNLKPDFFTVAEAIHGDYNRLLNCGFSSVTNYECYKGLHSAINSRNLFEIEHSLSRQFADTAWALYKGRHLFNFVDNHDVPRIYSVINDKRNVAAAFAILFAMPGIPCIYYGSEVGAEGQKGDNDVHLRPSVDEIDFSANPELYAVVKKLTELKNTRKSLQYGSYYKVVLSNEYFCIGRACDNENTLLAVNISDNPVTMNVGKKGRDLLSGAETEENISLQPHSFIFIG